MNTTKKIAIALAVIMVVTAMAAPAVMGSDTATYTATVGDLQNTYISAFPDITFGGVTAGTPFAQNELAPSLTLTNDGNHDAKVSAKFTSKAAAAGANDYGLVGDTDVVATTVLIDGTNFKLGKNTHETALKNDGTDQELGVNNNVPAGGSVDYDAQLNVPSGQKGDTYRGDVLLTFAEA